MFKGDNVYAIKALLRLDLRSRFGFGAKIGAKKVGKWISNFIFSAVIYAIVLTGIYFITKMFASKEELKFSFLVLSSMVSLILQFLVCTSALVKNLYFSGDNEMLLRFPVNGTQIFIAKSIYVFIYNFLISCLLLLPIYICFGILTKLPPLFYVWSAFITFVSSFIPFFLANIVAIPVMMFVNAIKNKFGIILGIMLIMVVAGFSAYMLVLRTILDYLQTRELTLFSPEVIANLQNFSVRAFPFNMFAYLLNGQRVGTPILYLLGLALGLGAIAFLIVHKWYFKTILEGIENQRSSFTKKTSNKQHTVFASLMKREFLMIFRSTNYSFQYLAMAIAAPFMVYFCNDIASVVGIESVGSRILPGLSLLVVTIFVTVIVSFAATAISREGNQFFFTKIIPVPYAKQVFVKFVLYGVVATASVIASCVTVVLAKFISFTDSVYIFFISEFVTVMLTSICIRVDTKSPVFSVSGDGEVVEANKNMSLSIVMGLVLALIFGISSMIFSYIPVKIGNVTLLDGTITTVYYYLLGITAIMAAFSVAALFKGVNKRYNAIIQ